jgi:hypothetical protein
MHLLNLEPTDVRDYLVKYEQLDSYLPPLEESGKVNAMAPVEPNRQAQNQGASGHQRNNNNNNQANTAVVPYNSQQANRGRGNNNNFRGRGNRANNQKWNRVDSQRQNAPNFQVNTPDQASANRGFSNPRGRGRGNWQPRNQYNNNTKNYNQASARQPAYQQQSYEQQPYNQQQQYGSQWQQGYQNPPSQGNLQQQQPQQQAQPSQKIKRCYICPDAHVLNDCPYRFNVPRFQPVYSLEEEEAVHQHAANHQEYQYPPQ